MDGRRAASIGSLEDSASVDDFEVFRRRKRVLEIVGQLKRDLEVVYRRRMSLNLAKDSKSGLVRSAVRICKWLLKTMDNVENNFEVCHYRSRYF